MEYAALIFLSLSWCWFFIKLSEPQPLDGDSTVNTIAILLTYQIHFRIERHLKHIESNTMQILRTKADLKGEKKWAYTSKLKLKFS